MDTPESSPLLRIGELSRRLGVSDHVLRAWEGRYGLLQPVRSAGGFRLYSEADALRVRRMQAHPPVGPPVLGEHRSRRTAGPTAGSAGPTASQRRKVSRPAPSGKPWTPSMSRPHRQSLTGSGPTSPWRRASGTWYCRISPSSGSAGSGEQPASPRNTSPPTSSAGGSPGWPGAGGTGTDPAPSSPAPQGSFTTWR